jgi:hypothetical protein
MTSTANALTSHVQKQAAALKHSDPAQAICRFAFKKHDDPEVHAYACGFLRGVSEATGISLTELVTAPISVASHDDDMARSVRRLITQARAARLRSKDGLMTAIVHRSSDDTDGPWRVTRLETKNGKPWGHTCGDSFSACLDIAADHGCTVLVELR